MGQDEPFRQLAQNFRQHATDENEKLKARYESNHKHHPHLAVLYISQYYPECSLDSRYSK